MNSGNRSKNFSETEKVLLLDIIKETNTVDLIQNKKNDYRTIQQKSLAWDTILSSFNSQSCQTRTLRQLSTLWKDLKQRAKKAYTAVKQDRVQTGGGPATVTMDPVSSLVVDLVPASVLEPLTNINDSDVAMHEDIVSSESSPLPRVESLFSSAPLIVNTALPSSSKAPASTPRGSKKRRADDDEADDPLVSAKLRAIENIISNNNEEHCVKMRILNAIEQRVVNKLDAESQTDSLGLLDLLNL